MELNVGLKIEGKATITVDRADGTTEVYEEHNRLTDYFIDNFMTDHLNLRDGTYYCKLFSSGTEKASKEFESRNLSGTVATSSYYFPSGTDLGDIDQIKLKEWDGDICSVIDLSTTITIGEYDEFTVEYERSITRGASSWSGTITGGSKDGTKDINWIATINDAQLAEIASKGFGAMEYFAFYPYAMLGTDNTASDLANDGDSWPNGSNLSKNNIGYSFNYDSDNKITTLDFGWDTGVGNGSVGEVVVGYENDDGDSGETSFLRVTFNPKLDKTNNFRLYLTFNVQFQRGQ